MNELANTANQLLLLLIEAATKTGQFLVEQMPDVIQQLLLYNLVSSIIGIFIGAGILFVAYWATQKAYKYVPDNIFDDGRLGWIILAAILYIVGSASLLCNLITALKIWLAPKVWLIEYAANLIK